MNWHNYMKEFARTARLKSKDPNTQVGAAIFSAEFAILSTGFNGFARGVTDSIERWERPEKYEWVIHAELNAILHAAKAGSFPSGSQMFVTMFPCVHCAQCIIQAGIKKVFIDSELWDLYLSSTGSNQSQWIDKNKKAIQAFKEAGVKWELI